MLEIAWSGFRGSFGKEYPFTVGIILSFVFVALGAIVVDIYLKNLDEQRAKRERDRELRTWDPIARRIFGELGSPLSELADAVYNAQMGLWKAEVDGTRPDRDRFAQSIEDAFRPLRAILKEQFPTMVLRPELRDAARNAEEACTAAEAAASIIRRWNFTSQSDAQTGHSGLREAVECVLNRQLWFQARQAPPEEIAVEAGK